MFRSSPKCLPSSCARRAISASQRFFGLATAGLILAIVTGCQGPPDHRDMDATEKAREIARHRRLSLDARARYLESRSVEDLLEIVEHQRITTEIAPSTCPTCFRDYGKSLSMVGRHYRWEMIDAQQQAELASDPAEARAARAAAEELEEKMRDYFERAYRAYYAFFRHPDTKVRPAEDFYRVMEDAAYVGNWARAQEYLGYFASAVGNQADANMRKTIEELARHYRRRAQIEQAQAEGARR